MNGTARTMALLLLLGATACSPAADSAAARRGAGESPEPAASSSGQSGIEVEYVAHAAFRLRDRNGTELLIDPFASRVWLGYDWPSDIEPDAVLITHPHYDHDAGRYRGAPFPWDAAVPVVDGPGTHSFGDFVVTGIQGKHADPYGKEFGQLNTLMVIEAYGLRIAHLGDNGPLTEAMVHGLGRVDVLMLPADGVDHIISKAVTSEILASLDPAVVIPMHYRLPDLEPTEDGPGDLGEIDPWLAGRNGVRHLGSNQTTIRVTELPDPRQILVFDHAPYVTRPQG